MFSNLQKRAPNATIINLSSKMKATKKGTMSLIMSMPEYDRHRKIEKMIGIAASTIKSNKEHNYTEHARGDCWTCT